MSRYNQCQNCEYGTAHYDKNIRLTDYACLKRIGVQFRDDTSECEYFKQRGK